jgi:hypothetical protein
VHSCFADSKPCSKNCGIHLTTTSNRDNDPPAVRRRRTPL